MITQDYSVRFRHENKYLLGPMQAAVLRVKVGGIMPHDPHTVDTGGKYAVHSLYFDDKASTCLNDNLRGADPRSKFRIRYYNRDISYIMLEKKIKQHGMGIKNSCALSVDECEQLLSGHIPEIQPEMSETKKALLTEMRVRAFSPRIIVDYERIPFIYPGGNVRITFDRRISSSTQVRDFLDGGYSAIPVEMEGKDLMEVKWDAVLPQHIKDIVQPETLTWTAFSKYTMCRLQSL